MSRLNNLHLYRRVRTRFCINCRNLLINKIVPDELMFLINSRICNYTRKMLLVIKSHRLLVLIIKILCLKIIRLLALNKPRIILIKGQGWGLAISFSEGHRNRICRFRNHRQLKDLNLGNNNLRACRINQLYWLNYLNQIIQIKKVRTRTPKS